MALSTEYQTVEEDCKKGIAQMLSKRKKQWQHYHYGRHVEGWQHHQGAWKLLVRLENRAVKRKIHHGSCCLPFHLHVGG
jgi:hypothetical protein